VALRRATDTVMRLCDPVILQFMTLIGRADEVARIEAALGRLGTKPWVLEVVGEPGIGKTRLLNEVQALAESHGHLVVSARSTEQARGVPFSALADALDDHVVAADLGSSQRAVLATLFPALGTPKTKIAPYRLHRAMRGLLEALAKPSGLVVVLDDLHWVDDGTAELLAHLLRHQPSAPVLLAMAHRPAQAPAHVTAAIDLAARAGEAERIALAPLSVDSFAELVGPGVSRAECEELHRGCAGNPFYLGLLAAQSENDAEATLLSELDGVAPTVRHVARAAAVAGDPFEPGLVAAIADLDTATAFEALDDLLARDLIRGDRDERKLRFRHPLVRQIVYLDGGEEWGTLAHGRAAAELARRNAPVVIRAHHTALAARAGDLDAISTLIRAATSTMSEAPSTAAHWLQVALDLLPPDQPHLRLQLLSLTGKALAITGRLPESRAMLRQALTELPTEETDARMTAATMCGMVERLLGEHDAARATLLAEMTTGTHTAQAAALKLELVVGSVVRGAFGENLEKVREVLDFARRSQDRVLEAAALALQSWAGYMASDLDGAIRSCDAAKALYDGLPDGELAEWIELAVWLSHAERFLDRFDDGLRHVDRAIALARATGRSHVLTQLLAHRANLLRWLGRFDEARECAEQAAALAGSQSSRLVQRAALVVLSRVELITGDAAAAVRIGQSSSGDLGDEQDWWSRHAAKSHALALTQLDRVDRMDQVMTALGGPDLTAAEPLSRPIDYEELVRADVTVGQLERAQDWAWLAERAANPALPTRVGLSQLAWANVHMARGESQAALTRAQAAATAFERAGARFDVGRSVMVWGRAAAAAGASAAAIVQFERATRLFTESGAPILAAQATRELRQLGRRAAGSETLTARELEIAELAANGKTNRQIAEALVISERTVGTHLSRIYAKLGVSSRAALAAQRTRGK
jgi:ATP/maltotriose-dependent transcriptional regulator MalT